MLFLFAAVGVIAVGVLLWRAFGVQAAGEIEQRPRPRRAAAPDDDPEFLRSLDERNRRDPE